jgi:prolyl 4-hydroxylase
MDISELRSLAASGNSEAQYHLYMQLRGQSSDEAREWLNKSVDKRFPPALYESGAAELAAESPNVQGGLKLIEDSAAAGFAAADYHLACLKVHAYGCEQDLDSAKVHLRRAATAGDPNALYATAMMFARSDQDAARENAFILYQTAAAAGYPLAFEPTARRLAEGIGTAVEPGAAKFWLDLARRAGFPVTLSSEHANMNTVNADAARAEEIAALTCQNPGSIPEVDWPKTTGIGKEVVCESPRIVQIGNMLSDDECTHLVNAAQPHLRRSYIVHPDSGEPSPHPMRTSHDGALPWQYHDIPYYLINQRYYDTAGMPQSNGENMSVIHYGQGEEYKLHYDFFEAGSEDERAQLEAGGQRVISMFTYLNELPAGGETEFPELGISITPKRGLAVIFSNCHEDGSPDQRTLHASRPVESGEKWLAVKWFRESDTDKPL